MSKFDTHTSNVWEDMHQRAQRARQMQAMIRAGQILLVLAIAVAVGFTAAKAPANVAATRLQAEAAGTW
jgi:hypothetical protein